MTIPLNAFDREEHDGDVNAKNVSIVKSTATIFAVVNTGAAGVGQSLVTVLNPISIAGNVTIDSGNVSLKGNVTVVDGGGSLTVDNSGTFAVQVDSNTAWSDPSTYIGLATVDIGSAPTLTVDATTSGDVPITLDGETVATTFSGNVTIDSGVITTITNPVAIKGNLTIDSVAGTVTVDATGQGDVPITLDSVVVAVDATGQGDVPITLGGEAVVLGAGAAYVGLATVVLSNQPALVASAAYIGLATVVQANQPALVAGAAYVGLATVDIGKELPVGTKFVGLATVDVGKSERYSYAYTSGPTTDWAVKAAAGFLHAIHVGTAVASSVIEISDHASDGDGAVKIYQAGDTIGPAVYPLNMTMGTGITLDITNQTHVTVIYK